MNFTFYMHTTYKFCYKMHDLYIIQLQGKNESIEYREISD